MSREQASRIAGIMTAVATCAFSVVCVLAVVEIRQPPGAPAELLTDPATRVCFSAAGVLLAAAGALRIVRELPACCAVATSWCAPVLGLWSPDPALRFAGVTLAAALPAALLHLCSEFVDDEHPAFRRKRIVMAGYAMTASLAASRFLLTDPLRDPGCIVFCDPAVWAAPDAPLASRMLAAALAAVGLGLSILTAALGLRIAGPRHARTTRLIALLLVICALTQAGSQWWPGSRPPFAPPPDRAPGVFVIHSVIAAALGAALIIRSTAQATARRRIRAAAADLLAAVPPRGLRDVLAHASRDPELELAFTSTRGWIDEHGEAVDWPMAAEHGRIATVTSGGECVARIRLHRNRVAAPDFASLLSPAAVFALDIERTRAAHLAELASLRTARAQAVVAGDLVRQRIERDVHDGAQQRLIAASFELLRASQAARERGDDRSAVEFELLRVDAIAVLERLRAVSGGLHPPMLSDTAAGLSAAVEQLARTASVPVHVSTRAIGNLPIGVALTVHQIVAEAITHAREPVEIGIRTEGGAVECTLHGVTAGLRPELCERVIAQAGRIEEHENERRVTIPCVS